MKSYVKAFIKQLQSRVSPRIFSRISEFKSFVISILSGKSTAWIIAYHLNDMALSDCKKEKNQLFIKHAKLQSIVAWYWIIIEVLSFFIVFRPNQELQSDVSIAVHLSRFVFPVIEHAACIMRWLESIVWSQRDLNQNCSDAKSSSRLIRHFRWNHRKHRQQGLHSVEKWKWSTRDYP